MKVWFRQFYIEPGVWFPFSHLFQRRMSREVSALVKPSASFIKKYGKDLELVFNISAKKGLRDNEIRGPAVFRKTKDVEFTLFLPFGVIIRHADPPRRALQYLLKGVCEVFDRLEIDKERLLENHDRLIEGICSDATMLHAPSWDQAENTARPRKVFEAYFNRSAKASSRKRKGSSMGTLP